MNGNAEFASGNITATMKNTAAIDPRKVPKMILENYTPQALATAKPTALEMQYLGPGLIAECGEVYGARAKGHREQWSDEKRAAEIIEETGDIAWFLAVTIHVLAEYRSPDVEYAPDIPIGVTPLAHILTIAAHIEALTDQAPNPVGFALAEPYARQAWAILAERSHEWTGVPFTEVLRVNVAKLGKRYAKAAN